MYLKCLDFKYCLYQIRHLLHTVKTVSNFTSCLRVSVLKLSVYRLKNSVLISASKFEVLRLCYRFIGLSCIVIIFTLFTFIILVFMRIYYNMYTCTLLCTCNKEWVRVEFYIWIWLNVLMSVVCVYMYEYIIKQVLNVQVLHH